MAITTSGTVPTGIALPALEDFINRLQMANKENSGLSGRLNSLSNKLNTEGIKEEELLDTIPVPRRFEDGLLSKLEFSIVEYQNLISNQEKIIRKLESLL